MKKIILLLLFIVPCLAFAQKKTPISKNAKSALVSYINELKSDSVLRTAAWSIRVVNPANNDVVVSYNDQMSLLPASNMKVITTGVGLMLLGNDYRFSTQLKYYGTITPDSVLVGNLYIVGSGDPSLGSSVYPQTAPDSVFQQWTEAIKSAGIKRINGQIVADPTQVFDNENRYDSWNWGDIGLGYGAGTNGIQFMDNLFRVKIAPAKTVGQPADISFAEYYIPNAIIKNATTTTANGSSSINIYSTPYSPDVYITGTVPVGSQVRTSNAAIPDPAYTCAWYFNDYLNRNGIMTLNNIEVCYSCTADDNAKRTTLATYSSPTLAELVYETNKNSNNCFAESIFKILGYEKEGVGSSEAGRQAVAEALKKQKLNLDGYSQADGSGLSRRDMVTTTLMCDFLAMMIDQPQFEMFKLSLPIAGVDGTMKKMLKGTAAYNNLQAKSGTLGSVRGYSGYVTTKGGHMLCFSIIFNNFTASSADATARLEKLMRLVAEIK